MEFGWSERRCRAEDSVREGCMGQWTKSMVRSRSKKRVDEAGKLDTSPQASVLMSRSNPSLWLYFKLYRLSYPIMIARQYRPIKMGYPMRMRRWG